jgi:hypothetical protein
MIEKQIKDLANTERFNELAQKIARIVDNETLPDVLFSLLINLDAINRSFERAGSDAFPSFVKGYLQEASKWHKDREGKK